MREVQIVAPERLLVNGHFEHTVLVRVSLAPKWTLHTATNPHAPKLTFLPRGKVINNTIIINDLLLPILAVEDRNQDPNASGVDQCTHWESM